MDWTFAACRGVDPELFFPVGTSGPAVEQATAAKFVCGSCPIRSACLAWALETGQEAGVWGGASEDERRAMRRSGQRVESLPLSA
jgi:WhiB family redox-sensing transcriptional regulator